MVANPIHSVDQCVGIEAADNGYTRQTRLFADTTSSLLLHRTLQQ
jgi:hypothetical protein